MKLKYRSSFFSLSVNSPWMKSVWKQLGEKRSIVNNHRNAPSVQNHADQTEQMCGQSKNWSRLMISVSENRALFLQKKIEHKVSASKLTIPF
jgi:hypothetical protein